MNLGKEAWSWVDRMKLVARGGRRGVEFYYTSGSSEEGA